MTSSVSLCARRGPGLAGTSPPSPSRSTVAAPTPAQAAKLTPARLRRLLLKAGRRRHLDRDVERLREVFTDTYLHQPPVVENAMGIQLCALLRQFEAAATAADELAEAAIAHLGQDPDAGQHPQARSVMPAR